MNSIRIRTAAAVAVLATAAAGSIAVTSADAASGHAPNAKHTSRITFVVGGSDDKHTVAVLHGGITDAGKDSSPNDDYDVVYLQHGTIRVNHPEKNAKFNSKVDPKTCYATFTEKGTGTIDHATGAYKGYTGKISYTGTGTYILAKKNGKCDMNSEGTGLFVVHGSGTVTH